MNDPMMPPASSTSSCPHCGSPRLTTAEEPCWSCHALLPAVRLAIPANTRYAREAQAPLPTLNPGLIFCGILYCGAACSAIVFVADYPLVAVASALLALPALLITLLQFSRRHRLGLPILVSDVILTFLNFVGILPAAAFSLVLAGTLIGCLYGILTSVMRALTG